MNGSELKVVVFGGTGSAGQGIVRACLDAPEVREIVAPTRRPLGLGEDAKLSEVVVSDFGDPEVLARELGAHVEGVDACMFALGVSQSQVPEEDRYRVIMHDYPIAAAVLLKRVAPEHTFHFITGAGTKAGSRMMWSRVKAQTEADLGELGLRGLICYRPGYIHPERLRPEPRTGERLMRALHPLLRWSKGMSITAREVGQAMLQAQAEGRREGVLENPAMRELASQRRR
ncbi:hypothetical protein [Enhygromyxa salina]|uniref:NAD(P)-binding domain-containing protein n=1 Tax=Enhygromyxa salina TaxID=215803 RepID=A0A2S9YAN7_9BACT|nr:hypothetical protein [Enhygromyxa salina]PRQ02076.1 hypothetical protein ENSA7_55830 [Enhygromyxa salina]